VEVLFLVNFWTGGQNMLLPKEQLIVFCGSPQHDLSDLDSEFFWIQIRT